MPGLRHPNDREVAHKLSDGFTADEEGCDLHDVHSARLETIKGLRDMMASELKDGLLKTASFIEIEDENHNLLMTVPFSKAVTVQEPSGAGRAEKNATRPIS